MYLSDIVVLCEQAMVRALRNYSDAFITGITGSVFRTMSRSTLKTGMHLRVVNLSSGNKRTLVY